jgi:hypothetical protein
MYWKTIHMLLKNDRSTNELPPLHDPFNNVLKNICRSLSRLRDSRRKSESNQTLSSLRMVTSLVGMHVMTALMSV